MNYKTFLKLNKGLKENLFKELDNIEINLQLNYQKEFEQYLTRGKCSYCKSFDIKYLGSYERFAYINGEIALTLSVKRIICAGCKRSEVVLPWYLIKYKRYIDKEVADNILTKVAENINELPNEVNITLGAYIHKAQRLRKHRCISSGRYNEYLREAFRGDLINDN